MAGFGQGSVIGRHREGDVVCRVVVVGVVGGCRVGSCGHLGNGQALDRVVGDVWGCIGAWGDRIGCCDRSWVGGVGLLVHVHHGLGGWSGHVGVVQGGRVGSGQGSFIGLRIINLCVSHGGGFLCFCFFFVDFLIYYIASSLSLYRCYL